MDFEVVLDLPDLMQVHFPLTLFSRRLVFRVALELLSHQLTVI